MTPRLRVLSLTLLVGALALTGCGNKPKVGTGSSNDVQAAVDSPGAKAPKDTLLASIKHLADTTYQFSGTQAGLNATGVADPAQKAATLSAHGSVQGTPFTEDLIGIDTNYWVKMDMGATYNKAMGIKAGKWMHIDTAKLGSAANLPFDLAGGDVMDLSGLLNAVTQVQAVDTAHFTGVIDLTAAKGVSSYAQDDLDKLGAMGKSMPFTAALDSTGHLTNITVDTSSVDKTLTVNLNFTDFGSPVTIHKPAGAVEAADGIYNLFK